MSKVKGSKSVLLDEKYGLFLVRLSSFNISNTSLPIGASQRWFIHHYKFRIAPVPAKTSICCSYQSSSPFVTFPSTAEKAQNLLQILFIPHHLFLNAEHQVLHDSEVWENLSTSGTNTIPLSTIFRNSFEYPRH